MKNPESLPSSQATDGRRTHRRERKWLYPLAALRINGMLAKSHQAPGRDKLLYRKLHARARPALIAGRVLAAIAVLFASLIVLADAQDMSPDTLRALQQRATGGNGNNDTNPTAPDRPVIQAYRPVPQPPQAPPSILEGVYSRRAGRQLNQVGYDALGVPTTIFVAQTGALQDSYVLGVGDELVFELRGQENSSYRQRVDKSGSVVLPKLNPIPAAGRTLADFRRSLADAVNRAYVSTTAYASLGDVHQISVLVTGDVRSPGMRILSALSSPVDAILLSGGISKSGSLRNVRLIRNGSVQVIDLYKILLKGGDGHIGMLRDGDRIYVAPLGATVAIAGSVNRPGIYELPIGTSAIAADALVALAGGVLLANSYDISKTMLDRDGTTRLIPIPHTDIIRSGEIAFVDPSRSADLERVAVAGAVQLPGIRPLTTTRTTADVFHSVADLQPTAYGPFAIVVRRDLHSNSTTIIPFSIVQALQHLNTLPLQSNDDIFVFTFEEMRALTRIATKNANAPYVPGGGNNSNNNNGNNNNGNNNNNNNNNNNANNNGDNQDQSGTLATPGSGSSNQSPVLQTGSPQGDDDSSNATTSGSGSNVVLGAAATGANGQTSALNDPRLRPGQMSNSSTSDAVAAAQAIIRSESGATRPSPAPSAETDDQIARRIAYTLSVPREMLENAVRDQLVWVLDQVRLPGVYAAASGTTLSDMIEAAGGALNQTDLSSVEVTSTSIDRLSGTSHTSRSSYSAGDVGFKTVLLRPLDVVRLRQVYTDRSGETVTVAGEVRFPGLFDITREERLSSVLQRAGGLTEVAYPYGAVFTRRTAAVHEKEGNERSAHELEGQLALLAASPSQTAGPQNNFDFLMALVQRVRNAPTLGRVTVTADPVVLASRPDIDVILEPGDAIYIPKRPSSIAVTGEVLNPGSFQFHSNLASDDYIKMAGGPTQIADDGKTFVVLPDGSAVPIEENWLSFGSGGHIPPGSTIVVPRDLRPFEWSSFLKDATQIFSQLAVAAASLAVLQNNN